MSEKSDDCQPARPGSTVSEPVFRVCACGSKPYVHGRILLSGGGETAEIRSPQAAQDHIDALLRQGLIVYVDALRLRHQVLASGMNGPRPNDFLPCSGCWIPSGVSHRHFVLEGEEMVPVFSTEWAAELLHRVFMSERYGLTREDVARIEASIAASGLPPTSEVDIVAKGLFEYFARNIVRAVGVPGGVPSDDPFITFGGQGKKSDVIH